VNLKVQSADAKSSTKLISLSYALHNLRNSSAKQWQKLEQMPMVKD